MGIKIIKKEDGVSRKIAESYSVLNLLTSNDSDNVSLAVSIAKDHDEITKAISDRVYYVLEGELIIDGEAAEIGDVVFVGANTEYNFRGTFKAVLVNSPPFKKNDEVIFKL